MFKRRYSLVGSTGGSDDICVFDNVNYILESIDFGVVQEEMETTQYQLRGAYSTSKLSTRPIDIICWVVNSASSTEFHPGPSYVDRYKHKLQSVCSPMSEFTLRVEEYKTRGSSEDWFTVFSIKVRLESSIEWASTLEDNNAFACKCAIHLVALDPFFYAESYDLGTTRHEYYMLNPYSEDFSENTQFAYTYYTGNASTIWAKNIGNAPKLFLKGTIAPQAGICNQIWFRKSTGEDIIYDIPGISLTTATPITFDMESMLISIGGTKYYPSRDSRSIYFKRGESGTVQVFLVTNISTGRYVTHDTIITSNIGFLEV